MFKYLIGNVRNHKAPGPERALESRFASCSATILMSLRVTKLPTRNFKFLSENALEGKRNY
jgi:hypothetical protein